MSKRFWELSLKKPPQRLCDVCNVNAHKSFSSQFWWKLHKIWIIRQNFFILINCWEMNRDTADGWVRTRTMRTEQNSLSQIKDWGYGGFTLTDTHSLSQSVFKWIRAHIRPEGKHSLCTCYNTHYSSLFHTCTNLLVSAETWQISSFHCIYWVSPSYLCGELVTVLISFSGFQQLHLKSRS